jgi:hypothetical protein
MNYLVMYFVLGIPCCLDYIAFSSRRGKKVPVWIDFISGIIVTTFWPIVLINKYSK